MHWYINIASGFSGCKCSTDILKFELICRQQGNGKLLLSGENEVKEEITECIFLTRVEPMLEKY